MEHWRELAEMVPGTLLTVVLDPISVLRRMDDSIQRSRDAGAQTMGMFLHATESTRMGEPQFGVGLPSEVPDVALPEFARLAALHARAGYAFDLYAKHLALDVGNSPAPTPASALLVPSWRRRHRNAAFRAMDARRKLRSAASSARAAGDAARLAVAFHPISSLWILWAAEFTRLKYSAIVCGALARIALRRMRNAVALEFYDAWRVLNG